MECIQGSEVLPQALALSLVLLSSPEVSNSKGVLHKGLQRHATTRSAQQAYSALFTVSTQFIAEISAPIQAAIRQPRPFAWQTACALCMLPARVMSENSQCYDMLCALSHSSQSESPFRSHEDRSSTCTSSSLLLSTTQCGRQD